MTTRQRLFFKELLQSKSGAAAARKAGYSKQSCRVSAYKNITKYNDFFVPIMIAAGIDINSLGKSLKDGLKSKDERVKVQYIKIALQIIDKIIEHESISLNNEPTFDLGAHARECLEKLRASDNE